ncbi:hypothetical protein PhCBS80983_g04367 [Powellomyces hirtus]|uniref:RRM domain-containing protein n=1 Tax=Powellomyces hirtus TaxID=109895 RepID=A0A507DZN3_9FUNG|nr:hypothetical protein PhCBS80983_g04367 [Powellomyces hirtus]
MSGYYPQEDDQSAYYGAPQDYSYADPSAYQYHAQPQQSHYAAPVQYAASANPTTYGASAEYYSAPYYANPTGTASSSSSAAAYPVGYSSKDSGGVPYPTGYTIESETGAVPYPAGYTPSSATANVVRVHTDEDRKAAALAALPAVPVAQPLSAAPGSAVDSKGRKKKPILRAAGGEAWEDATLLEWDSNDFRLFCGDLGNEVTDDLLLKSFSKYPSVLRARVVRDNRSNKSKGFGFVSFKDPNDFVKAMREMNGKYVGNRPIKLRKSTWTERTVDAKTLRKIQQTAIFKPVLKTVAKK